MKKEKKKKEKRKREENKRKKVLEHDGSFQQ